MNKVVMITGATGGLGQALAKQLDEKGYKLALCGRNHEKMDNLSKLLKHPCLCQCFDMSDEDGLKKFVKATVDNFGQIDCLINCSGANTKRDNVLDMNLKDFKYMMELNVYSHIRILQEVYPELEKKQGHIVEILSTCALYENKGISAYSASKAAMASISKTLLKEIKDKHISVTNVYPGGINTGFREADRPAYMKADSVAAAIINCISLPKDAMIQELILRPEIEDNF